MLNAELRATNYTAATTVSTLLGTNAPTATANMTELTGTGYTSGGTVMTFNAPSAAATANASSATWTNGSGGTWSIVGLEIWGNEGGGALRHLFGTWTGQPISVSNTNAFAVAAAGIAISLVLFNVFASAVPAA